ncbi:MAG: CRISPR-associated protein Csx15 [candidate division KSB1 bacterium]|nr:CRISPR-associated protein Csx15 [candidate division KSB1 bacterium]MDZ7391316.1 CRISPR-associated protein Csx15 [candidate division KSB1 bacterium]
MTLINFGHPLTQDHLAAIARLVGQELVQTVEVKTHFDHQRPFAEQAKALVDAVGFTSEQWQTTPLVVNLPGLGTIAALLVAELHGRCGYFPAVVRLRPSPGSTPPRFEVAEILNLQAVRDAARATR